MRQSLDDCRFRHFVRQFNQVVDHVLLLICWAGSFPSLHEGCASPVPVAVLRISGGRVESAAQVVLHIGDFSEFLP